MATPKNTNPKPKIQKVTKPIAKQIQPAITAEDFGAGGAIGSGGGFIYSARFSARWVSSSMTESFFNVRYISTDFVEHWFCWIKSHLRDAAFLGFFSGEQAD